MPACAHTPTRPAEQGPPPQKEAKADRPDGTVSGPAGNGTPDQVLATAGKTGRPSEDALTQIRYAAPSSNRDLIPRPLPLTDPSTPPRDPSPTPDGPAAAPSVEVKIKAAEEPPLVAALRCYLDKRPAEALAWLQRYDKGNQDLLVTLLPLVARLSEGSLQRADQREVGAFVSQLEGAEASLRHHANLKINKFCFCERIKRFGAYKEFEEGHEFRPGDRVNVYLELENFSTTVHGKYYRVSLSSEGEIRRFNRDPIWKLNFNDADQAQISLTRLHDFFYAYSFVIPPLATGHYTLWLRLTDVPTKRTVEHTLDFHIAPARGLTKGTS
jgi:hypothetical protein